MAIYYYTLRVSSSNTYPVVLRCNLNELERQFDIRALEANKLIQLVVKDYAKPEDMTCFSKKNGMFMKINGVKQIIISPSLYYDSEIIAKVSDKELSTIQVTNPLSVSATLKWDTTSENYIDISPGVVNQTVNVPQERSMFPFKAVTKNGRPLTINGKLLSKISINSSATRYFVIGEQDYYIPLNIENVELFDTVIRWNIHGKEHSSHLKGLTSKQITLEDSELDSPLHPISIQAFRIWRNKPILINNDKTFIVYAKTNKYDFVDVVISSKPTELKKVSFLVLSITNLIKKNVKLVWTNNESKIIQAGANQYMLTLPFKSDWNNIIPLVKFSASIPGDNEKIKINNRNTLFLKPRKKKHIMRIILTDSGK